MENTDLLEKVINEAMNEDLRKELLRYLFKGTARRTKSIPMLNNHPTAINHDDVVERMKSVSGGTCASVAKILGISSQGFNNQINRKAISGNSIIDLHLKPGYPLTGLQSSG